MNKGRRKSTQSQLLWGVAAWEGRARLGFEGQRAAEGDREGD